MLILYCFVCHGEDWYGCRLGRYPPIWTQTQTPKSGDRDHQHQKQTKPNPNQYPNPNNTKPIPKNDTNTKKIPQATKITSTKSLQAECLERELCLLVMKGQKYSAKDEKVLGGASLAWDIDIYILIYMYICMSVPVYCVWLSECMSVCVYDTWLSSTQHRRRNPTPNPRGNRSIFTSIHTQTPTHTHISYYMFTCHTRHTHVPKQA